MIRITRITIAGRSAGGAFEGAITFPAGLFVFSAENHYGKSLAVTAIAWCLGLEPMYGVRDDDVTCFPIAAHEVLDLADDARRQRVLESWATLELVRDDDERIRITRPIVGNTTEASVEVIRGRQSRTSRLVARYQAMKDETGGLQNFLFEWMRFPRIRVVTTRGGLAEVYFENIAPHFFVDQKEGWTNIQALQVYRYGLVDVSQVSVEFLLGADQALRARLQAQEATARETRLKAQAAVLTSQVETLFARQGWAFHFSSHGTVADIAKRWTKLQLKEVARKEFNFDLASEQARLAERSVNLQKVLAQEGIDRNNAAAASDASQVAINLKNERHTLRAEFLSVRSQKAEYDQLAESIEHRMHAAGDVLRLKRDGIGRLEVVECPTCHRTVDPSSFGLTAHSTTAVEAHIEALKRDRMLVLENVKSVGDQITRLAARLAAVDEELRNAERALVGINSVAGSVREQLAKAASDLAALDREKERNHAIASELDDAQTAVNTWLEEARAVEANELSKGDLEQRVRAFELSLQDYLLAFGHKGVPADEARLVRLDDEYVPYLETRRIRALGSASDNARLIAAYALGLASASKSMHGHHPGFLLFDEPLQQNPDPDHRELFLKFLEGATRGLPGQLILFTSLHQHEIERLRRAGVRVDAPTTRHLLMRKASEAAAES